MDDPGHTAPECITTPNFSKMDPSLPHSLPIFVPITVSILSLTIILCLGVFYILMKQKHARELPQHVGTKSLPDRKPDACSFDNVRHFKWYPSYRSNKAVPIADTHDNMPTALYDDCWSQSDT